MPTDILDNPNLSPVDQGSPDTGASTAGTDSVVSQSTSMPSEPQPAQTFEQMALEVQQQTTQQTGQVTQPAGQPAPAAVPSPAGQAPAGVVQPAAPAAPFSVREQLSQLGYQHGFENDKQAFDWLLQSLHQTADIHELAQYGQQALPYWGEFQQYLAQRAAGGGQQPAAAPAATAAQPATGAATPTPAWNPPAYDQAWERHAKYDPETGMYRPIDQYASMAAVEALNKHHQFQQNWLQDFRKNPYEFISKGLEDRLKQIEDGAYQRAVQHVNQLRQQEQRRNVIVSTLTNNSGWAHQKDTAGQVLMDGRGFPVLTEHGRQYAIQLEELERAGVTDPVTQDRLARQLLWGAAGQPPAAQPAANPAPTNGHANGNGGNGESRRAAFTNGSTRTLRDALRSPSRDGTVANQAFDPTLPQNEQLSFLQLAVQEGRKQGINMPEIGPGIYR